MILPYLRGFIHPSLAPVTYLLVLLNIAIFGVTFSDYSEADRKMDRIIRDDSFLATQGAVFSIMIQRHPDLFSDTLRTMARQVLEGEREVRRTLGALALRNVTFMSRAAKYDFGGDEIAVSAWREKFLEFNSLQDLHPSYRWGLSDHRKTWLNWLSYQFAHSGFMHLFWNMFFLMIFGSFIETHLGRQWVVVTYLLGGLAGAGVFSLLSGISSSPLVGASGSISGMIGLVAFGWIGKGNLRFIYGLLPIKGYYGFAFLPSWVVLIALVLPDVSGYIAAHSDFGSVAYSAHIGGTLWGGVLAVFYRFASRSGSESFMSDERREFGLEPVVVDRPR